MSAGALERVLEMNRSGTYHEQYEMSSPTRSSPSRKRSLYESTDEASVSIQGYQDIFSAVRVPSSPASSVSSDLFQNFYGSPRGSTSSPFSSTSPSARDLLTSPTCAPASGTNFEPLLQTPSSKYSDSESGLFGSPIARDAQNPFSVDLSEAAAARPDFKRRKTSPAELGSPSKSVKRSPGEKKGNGKDGEDVWPPDVEEAFYAALKIVPKLGRRKILVNSKPCGRNELIADYIYRKTKKLRSRKQVSSHIQVLKNMKRDDAEFMRLVSEPVDGVDDVFSPQALSIFGGSIQVCGNSTSVQTMQAPAALSAPSMKQSFSENSMLSPHSATSAFNLFRSKSCSPSPLLSPAISDCSSVSSLPASPASFANTDSPFQVAINNGLSSAFKEQMSFPFPAQPEPTKFTTCPMAPSAFCMWADGQNDTSHTFAQIPSNTLPRSTMYLEDIAESSSRFPLVADMHNHLPCQFIHVKLGVQLPQADLPISVDALHTQLHLSSVQDVPLTAVTTIYCLGQKITSLTEDLSPPSRINPTMAANASANPLASVSSSPATPDSPVTPGSNGSYCGPRHKHVYNAPFASGFWSSYLAGSSTSGRQRSECRDRVPQNSRSEINAFVQAIGGLSIMQEFVYRPDDPALLPSDTERFISPGSAIGDVVLVVIYEFEVVSALCANVSFLSLRRPAAPLSNLAFAAPSLQRRHSTAPRRPSLLSHSSSVPDLVESEDYSTEQHLNHIPAISFAASSPKQTLLQPAPKSNRLANKANLSLRIPSPGIASEGETPPITPWPQMVQTPNAPPPVVHTTDPEHRHRLGQMWAATSGDWNLASPALAGAFPPLDLPSPSFNPNLPTSLGEFDSGSALNLMTSQAIAAGTPIYPSFGNTGPPLESSFSLPLSHVDPSSLDSYFGSEDYFSKALKHSTFGDVSETSFQFF